MKHPQLTTLALLAGLFFASFFPNQALAASALTQLGAYSYTFPPAQGGSDLAVNPSLQQVFISGGMGQQGLLRINVTNPASMSQALLSYGGGVAVDTTTGRYASTNGGSTLYVYNSDDTLYDSEGITGCGGSVEADPATGRFFVSTQCNDRIAVYSESSKSLLANIVSGGVGSLVVFDPGTGNIFQNLTPNRNDGYLTSPIMVSSSGYGTSLPFRGFVRAADETLKQIYVSDNSGNLLVLDSATFATRHTFPGLGSSYVAADTALGRFYTGSGTTLTAYDAVTFAPLGTLEIGGSMQNLRMAPGDNRLYAIDGSRLYVLQTGASTSAPSISGAPATAVTAGSAYSFTPTAGNADSFSIANMPSWATFSESTGALTGTPVNADAGAYSNITISATNSVGTSSLPAFSIAVSAIATVPGAPTDLTATVVSGQATVSFTAPASNGGSAVTSYTVTANPGGITASGTASPITVSGLTNGAYTFTATAANSVGTGAASAASNSVTISVPPTISGAPATAGTGGVSYSFTPTSGNADSFSIANKPSWASFSESTGALTGTPADADAGAYANIVISATNSAGTSALAAFTIAVSAAPQLAIATATLDNATKDIAYNATIAASGGVGAISFSVTSGTLPTGLALAAGGAISGTPTVRVASTTFTVTASDTGGHTATQNYTMRVIDPAYRKLTLSADSWTTQKGVQSGSILVKVVDDAGADAAVSVDTTIALSSSSTSGRFTDGLITSSGNTNVPWKILGTHNVAELFYLDSTAGTYTITASGKTGTSSQPWGSDSHSITVTSAQLGAAITLSTVPTVTYSQSVTVSGTLKSSAGTALAGRSIALALTSPAGSAITSVPAASTDSAGSFSFNLSNSVLDRAGDWTANVAFAGDLDYGEASQSAAIKIVAASTSLTVNLGSSTVAPTGSIVISGTLSAQTPNATSLAGLPIAVTLTEPNSGTVHTVSPAPLTSDDAGHYSVAFSQFGGISGLWRVAAKFAGNGSLSASEEVGKDLSVVSSAGYAILIQGDLNGINRASYTASMDRIYKQLAGRFLIDDNIQYLSPEGASHNKVDDVASGGADGTIAAAITSWAYTRISQNGNAPLYIIMLDHGGKNGKFYLKDDSSYLTPDHLNGWLSTLEANLKTNFNIDLKTVIVDGSCYSGSFIPVLAKSGRTIITSSNAELPSVQGPPPAPNSAQQIMLGDSFVHTFIDYLSGNSNLTLMSAFTLAARNIGLMSPQTPLFADLGTGSGKSYEQLGADDGVASKGVIFGLSRAATLLEWTEVMPTGAVMLGSIPDLYVRTSGDQSTAPKTDIVWMEVKKPSFVAPASSGTLQIDLQLPRLTGRYNSAAQRWEFPADLNPNLANIFNEAGRYTLFFYAADTDGEQLPPTSATAYVNTAANQAPAAPLLQLPEDGATQSDPLIVFGWSVSSDPDSDPVTSTLVIYSDDSGAKGAELKRYELLPQGGHYLDAVEEKKSDGSALFSGGNSYWWEIVAVDGRGAASAGVARKFSYVPTNGLIGLVYGFAKDQAGNPLASASITAGAAGSSSTLPNGAFLKGLSSGSYNVTAAKAGYQSATQQVIVRSGKVSMITLTLQQNQSTTPGDCDGDGGVSIAEVQSAVNMFLGMKPVLSCVDKDGSSSVGISEVQKVVNGYLGL